MLWPLRSHRNHAGHGHRHHQMSINKRHINHGSTWINTDGCFCPKNLSQKQTKETKLWPRFLRLQSFYGDIMAEARSLEADLVDG